MDMMGQGFHRRRTSYKQLRDLHAHKVPFSSCTLPLRCFFSSSSVSPSAPPVQARSRLDRAAGIGSPHLHQKSHAPPRLRDRPFLDTERHSYSPGATFCNEDEDERDKDEENVRFCKEDGIIFEMVHQYTNSGSSHSMEISPNSSPKDYTTHESKERHDSILLQHTGRWQLHHSHWSDSTTQTTDIDPKTSEIGVGTLSEPSTMPAVSCSPPLPPSFSHRRLMSAPLQLQAPIPNRPLFKVVDRIEDLIKRGGWKY